MNGAMTKSVDDERDGRTYDVTYWVGRTEDDDCIGVDSEDGEVSEMSPEAAVGVAKAILFLEDWKSSPRGSKAIRDARVREARFA